MMLWTIPMNIVLSTQHFGELFDHLGVIIGIIGCDTVQLVFQAISLKNIIDMLSKIPPSMTLRDMLKVQKVLLQTKVTVNIMRGDS